MIMKKLLTSFLNNLFSLSFWYWFLGINAVIFFIFKIGFWIQPEYSVLDDIYTITTLIQFGIAGLLLLFMFVIMIWQKIKGQWIQSESNRYSNN